MANNEIKFDVRIRPSDRPGPVKAYADLTFLFEDGELEIMGFPIIQQPGQKHFVGFPQIKGRNKYFPVVEAKRETRERIVKSDSARLPRRRCARVIFLDRVWASVRALCSPISHPATVYRTPGPGSPNAGTG